MDPERKKQLIAHTNKFIKNLRNVRTLEELGVLVIQLTDFWLQDSAETRWVIKRLRDRLNLLAESEKSRERQTIYELIRNTVTLAMFSVDVLDKVQKLDEFRNDIEDMVEDIF